MLMSDSMASQIKDAEERAATSESKAAQYKAVAAGLRVLGEQVPDAEYVNGVWVSRSVLADGIAVEAIYHGWFSVGYEQENHGRSVPHVLFHSLKTPHGVFRVYTTDRVDVRLAFDEFNTTGKPLLECMLATTSAANKRYIDFKREEEQEALAKASKPKS